MYGIIRHFRTKTNVEFSFYYIKKKKIGKSMGIFSIVLTFVHCLNDARQRLKLRSMPN